MQEYLDNFDSNRHECLTRNTQAEKNIAELLERISKLTKTIQSNKTDGAAPSEKGFQDLKGDLALKQKEVVNSENTMEALNQGFIFFWTFNLFMNQSITHIELFQ